MTNLASLLDAVADTYDEVFTDSLVGKAQHEEVWDQLDCTFSPGQRILILNCATGVDAVHLAARGVEVWACDVSSRMLDLARRRIASSQLRAPVHLRATEEISSLQEHGPFDGALSNFGRLNCVKDMAGVGRDLASLLKPGARAVLCMAGTCVAWETALFLWKLRFREAFRRLGRGPVYIRLASDLPHIACWFPSVRTLRHAFRPYFRLLRWIGVGVVVPPTYLENQARRFPKTMRALTKVDPWLGRTPLLRGLADHVLLTFERLTP